MLLLIEKRNKKIYNFNKRRLNMSDVFKIKNNVTPTRLKNPLPSSVTNQFNLIKNIRNNISE